MYNSPPIQSFFSPIITSHAIFFIYLGWMWMDVDAMNFVHFLFTFFYIQKIIGWAVVHVSCNVEKGKYIDLPTCLFRMMIFFIAIV